MPRLLLVDDNPSIHRIAESLLAPTDVELVCVASAAEALDRLGRGERFDVALVDTAMPGMDGWTLLGRLRDMPETARIPIALMAGVLDPVDPAKLAKAPIQGFLKKPIELRELGDRVKALLATPVPVAPSPFSTVPATPARDLVKRAEASLPELRPELEEATVVSAAPVAVEPPGPVPEEDLLVLTAEDLWPEEPVAVVPEPAAAAPVLPDVHLELEELDLDSLQDLTVESLPDLETGARVHPPAPEPVAAALPVHAEEEDPLASLAGLEELETLPSDFDFPPPSAPPHGDAGPAEDLERLPVAASLVGLGGVAAAGLIVHELAQEPVHPASEPVPVAHQEPAPPPEIPEPEPESAAAGQAAAVSGHPAPPPEVPAAVSAEQARAVVQALLADPVLVDALVKAVVARMGDQVLREIAWEVMPDLAGRLQS